MAWILISSLTWLETPPCGGFIITSNHKIHEMIWKSCWPEASSSWLLNAWWTAERTTQRCHCFWQWCEVWFLGNNISSSLRASSDDRNPAAWRNGLLIIKYIYIYMIVCICISHRFTQRNILNRFSTWSYTPSVRNPVFVSKISNSVASGLYPRFLPTALLAPTSDCLLFQEQGVCAIRWLLGSAIPHPRVIWPWEPVRDFL